MSLKIEFPFYVTADDYHEFSYLQGVIQQLTGNMDDVVYKELGCDGNYHAMFYLKEQEKDKHLQKEIKRLIEDFEENA